MTEFILNAKVLTPRKHRGRGIAAVLNPSDNKPGEWELEVLVVPKSGDDLRGRRHLTPVKSQTEVEACKIAMDAVRQTVAKKLKISSSLLKISGANWEKSSP